MFSHMMVGANDIEESKVFYDAVLGTLGCKPGILSMNLSDQKRYMYIQTPPHDKSCFLLSFGVLRMSIYLFLTDYS